MLSRGNGGGFLTLTQVKGFCKALVKRWTFALWLLFLIEASPAKALDQPYRDVPTSHWAYRYIEVLRQEDITDGWYQGSSLWPNFSPDSPITRGEFALMILKALRLQPDTHPLNPFIDVTDNLYFYNRIKAVPWISTAYRRGIVYGSPDRHFYPNTAIRRAEAIAILIRSLGLTWYANALSPLEIQRILSPFPDWWKINASLLPENALAVKLRIIIGYPDGYLHPERLTSRAEAATIIYRSALFELAADPNPFSPDGDKIEDTTTISVRGLMYRKITDWEVNIGPTPNQPVKTFSRVTGGQLPSALQWDGLDNLGRLVPPGTYYYWGWISDSAGNTFPSATKPLVLEHKRLTASLFPDITTPGGQIRITATTTGGATKVVATTPFSPLTLSPQLPPGSATNSWTGILTVPTNAVSGAYEVQVQAQYPSGNRVSKLTFTVKDPVILSGKIQPNPAFENSRVTLSALSSPNVSKVTVTWPTGAVIKLQEKDPGNWEGYYNLPQALKPGVYPVLFTGETRDGRQKQVIVNFLLKSPLEDVIFVITD